MSSGASGGLSVTKVAEVAGLTPRAVRYYHSIGLLPEPPRDGSGYRRYGGKEVIELVRVARLRALGMPLPQIAQRVSATSSDDVSLADALGALADELDAEIKELVATRDRLQELARSETFDQPVKTLTQALQDQGVLGPADHLRASEKWAAALLDAVHPEGMPGVLAEASRLFGDSTVVEAVGPLRRRLGKLGARSSDAEIAALAADVATVLTSRGVDGQVDIGMVNQLLTDRLNPVQQRFMRELRANLQGAR
ncbi:MerR family DNA-binding transcriptional regulator [uncultured Jatrophihabitans sp.]|uniref:helix-turn-helix domain-containing protein n=1 Tax=uncultured Jatrophihabitans sp. TaxID=1610747 RepID=UPI0035CAA0A0